MNSSITNTEYEKARQQIESQYQQTITGLLQPSAQQMMNAYGNCLSSQTQVASSAARPGPEYGVDKAEFPGATFKTVYYVQWGVGVELPVIGEAYFPLIPPEQYSQVAFRASYPLPAFDTRGEAQRALCNVFRKNFQHQASRYLEQVVQAQLERGLLMDPELDLADALRKYLSEIEA